MTTHLAARRLRNGARGREHDNRADAERPLHHTHDVVADGARRAPRGRPHGGHDDEPVGAFVAPHAERSDAAWGDAGDAGGVPLDVRRHEIASADDDEVTRAVDDEEATGRQVAEIAGSKPRALPQRTAEISGGDGRTADDDLTDCALGQRRVAVECDDADLVTGERAPDADHGVPRRGRYRAALAREYLSNR